VRIAYLLYGMQSHQDAMFRALAALGDELLLVYPESLHGSPFDASRFAEYAQRYTWQSGDQVTKGDPWKADPPSADVLVPLVRDFDPDVVFMWSWNGRGYRKVMQDQRGKALRVLYCENFWWASPKQWLGRLTHRLYIDPLYDCAIVPGERAEWFARRLGFTPDRVIRGALSGDVAHFDRGPRTGEELASHRQFLFAGRFVPHKSPDVLAKAYRQYREASADPWTLAVAGEGPMASEFDGIEGVRRLGFLQPDDLVDEMHRSSCLVFPSQIDFYGVIVHEAAAAGLPLLVSEGAGVVSHYLQDGCNGWTTAPGNVTSLADAFARMEAAGPERLGTMSDNSRALARRMTPQIYATNFHEECERRIAAQGLSRARV
jgi:glycosyltransferase involved in cell wall biosynthesis